MSAGGGDPARRRGRRRWARLDLSAPSAPTHQKALAAPQQQEQQQKPAWNVVVRNPRRDGVERPEEEQPQAAVREVAQPRQQQQRTLVDVGANLTKLRDAQLRAELGRAAVCGVSRIVVTGTSIKATTVALRLASQNDALFFTAGVHPHDAHSCDEQTIPTLRDAYEDPSRKCLAIGETGLDYNRMLSPRDVQLCWFRAQVRLAKELDAPLFLHERDEDDPRRGPPLGSHQDLVRVLEEEGVNPERVCVHCFTGNAEELRDYVARGFRVGITGFVGMRSRGAALREALRRGILPLDRLLVETDAPYMRPDDEYVRMARLEIEASPRGGGRHNEPALLPAVVQALASCGLGTPDQIAAATTRNAEAFFPRLKEAATRRQEAWKTRPIWTGGCDAAITASATASGGTGM